MIHVSRLLSGTVSKTSANAAQKTRRRAPALTAARFHRSGANQYAAAIVLRLACAPQIGSFRRTVAKRSA